MEKKPIHGYEGLEAIIELGEKYPNGTLLGLPRGMKYDSAKPDLVGVCMLPPELVTYLSQVQDVIDYGAAKYSPDNWKLVANGKRRYASAAIRHLVAMVRGQWIDPESGLPHVAHVIVNVLFVAWLIQHGNKNEPNE